MLYPALRAAAGAALRWYYADCVVQGGDRIPARGPLLVVSNHPNALVDVLVIATALPRRVLFTAKATLFEHPLLLPLLRAVGVVPLRRKRDELSATDDGQPSPERNVDAFRAVSDALADGRAVLVFPEGISHDEPALAPLKTGAARMVLAARDAGVATIHILPVGLIFERKERPRSRILVRIGQPIDLDGWCARSTSGDAAHLTDDLRSSLRQVTLNFATAERAERAVMLARLLASIFVEPAPVGRLPSLATEAELAHRVEIASERLSVAPPAIVRRVDAFLVRADSLRSRLESMGIALSDVRISPLLHHGARFVVREAALVGVAAPIGFIGWIGHWIPLHAARTLAMRPLADDPSRDQPAMRTIAFGVAFVLAWYVAIGAALAWRWGSVPAIASVGVLFVAAQVDLALRDRVRRARERARTYLALRRDPTLRTTMLGELDSLVIEAGAIEQALLTLPVDVATVAVHIP